MPFFCTYPWLGAWITTPPPPGDWIIGIWSSSKSNMPIKVNGQEDKLQQFYINQVIAVPTHVMLSYLVLLQQVGNLKNGPEHFLLYKHSQKQSADWAVDVTAQVVPCWLGSWLKCNFWPVLRPLTQVYFTFTGLDITCISCFKTVNSGDIQSRERKITRVSYIWACQSSLDLISPPNWISTQRCWVSYFFWEWNEWKWLFTMLKMIKATVSWFLGWRIDRWAKKKAAVEKNWQKFWKNWNCSHSLFFFSRPTDWWKTPCEKSAIPGINWMWPKLQY